MVNQTNKYTYASIYTRYKNNNNSADKDNDNDVVISNDKENGTIWMHMLQNLL